MFNITVKNSGVHLLLFRFLQIVFHTVQEANDARMELADGFEIDEGDRQLTMRFFASKFISYYA